jgi:hypothetical protein
MHVIPGESCSNATQATRLTRSFLDLALGPPRQPMWEGEGEGALLAPYLGLE